MITSQCLRSPCPQDLGPRNKQSLGTLKLLFYSCSSSRNVNPNHFVPVIQDSHDNHCHECGMGGDLLCCDRCTKAFHAPCHDPPIHQDELDGVDGETLCNQCQVSDIVQ